MSAKPESEDWQVVEKAATSSSLINGTEEESLLSIGSKAKRDSQKRQGDAAFRSANYKEAVQHYSDALSLDPTNHVLLSNRSACFLKIGLFEKALEDAQACIKSNATVGHSRLGAALQSMQQWEGAVEAYEMVLKLDPENEIAKRELKVCRGQVKPSGESKVSTKELSGKPKQSPVLEPTTDLHATNNPVQPSPESAQSLPSDRVPVSPGTTLKSVEPANSAAKSENAESPSVASFNVKPVESLHGATNSAILNSPSVASSELTTVKSNTVNTTPLANLGIPSAASAETKPKASVNATRVTSLGVAKQVESTVDKTSDASSAGIPSAASPESKPESITNTTSTVSSIQAKHLQSADTVTQSHSLTTGTAVTPDTKHPRKGLSELSKQLRGLQATNESQANQIDRLERQLRIIAELKGVSVGDIRSALLDACAQEAHADLRNQVGVLRSELEAQMMAKNNNNADSFEKEASFKAIANLQLRVGELEEIEETLKSEIRGLYKCVSEEQGKSATLKATCEQQKMQIDDLLKTRAVVKVETQQSQWAVVVAEQNKKEEAGEEKRPSEELRNAELQVQLEKDRANLLEKQAEAREKESQLRNEQHKSRFQVQDERIFDLEQQLSSLYTAFEMLRQEHAGDQETRAALTSNLREADSQVARQLHTMSSQKSLPVAQATPLKSTSQPSLNPNSTAASLSYTSPGASQSYSTPQSAATYKSPAKSSPKPRPQRLYRDKFIQPPATSNVIQSQHVVSGYLMKRDKSILNKGWKKRYFVLHGSDGIYHLSYSEGPRTKIKGTIGFITTGVSTVARSSELHKQSHVFVLYANQNDVHSPVLYAAAENQQEFDRWMSALTLVTTGHDSTVAAASPQEQEAADHEIAVRMQMELMK